MKILILGSGVIGVTTAWFLAKNGHDVTVIDRQGESARECSFANGGQLSYCHAEPWSTPKAMKKAIRWMGKKDAPLLFRWRLDYNMWKWAFQFLGNCTKEHVGENTEVMLRLMLYSREMMHELQSELNLDFNYLQKGMLHIFDDEYSLNCSIRQSEHQKELGAPYERLTADECVAKEPALKHRKDKLFGGIYYPWDESGDVFKFTKELTAKCKDLGVKFMFGTEIRSLKKEGDKITAIETSEGDIEADKYVMSMGAYSSVYLRKVGISVPIYPMKGYSISVPVEESTEGEVPMVSITDQKDKIVYSHLGNVLRAAGTAEFAGYNHDILPYRTNMLKEAVKRNFPNSGDVNIASEWACLRPSTPNSIPILGKTPYDNLVMNTGHGTLGWTQAAASAKIVSDIIEDNKPAIDLAGLTLK